MATDARATEVEYPTADGKPMAETDWHYELLKGTRDRLAARYASRPDVYVSGNLMVYYVEGQPKVFLSPDTFVVFGVPNRQRPLYKTWEEGKYPDVVFEFTSKTTRRQDRGRKLEVYRDVWKVTEYFLFDPLGDYLKPPSQGYRRVGDEFAPLVPSDGALTSHVLGVTLTGDGTRLVMRDTVTGVDVLTDEERKAVDAERRAEEAVQKAVDAERKAADAEAELARLRAELAALRTKSS